MNALMNKFIKIVVVIIRKKKSTPLALHKKLFANARQYNYDNVLIYIIEKQQKPVYEISEKTSFELLINTPSIVTCVCVMYHVFRALPPPPGQSVFPFKTHRKRDKETEKTVVWWMR